jgi:hypothetical protein
MRTTLILNDDVVVQLERLCRARDASFQDVVNEALRRGLREMSAPENKRKPFRTEVCHMGEPLIDLDNVAEVLAYAEGEDHK